MMALIGDPICIWTLHKYLYTTVSLVSKRDNFTVLSLYSLCRTCRYSIFCGIWSYFVDELYILTLNSLWLQISLLAQCVLLVSLSQSLNIFCHQISISHKCIYMYLYVCIYSIEKSVWYKTLIHWRKVLGLSGCLMAVRNPTQVLCVYQSFTNTYSIYWVCRPDIL